MEKTNLAWAIVWAIMTVLCLAALIWNPMHFFTLAISIFFLVVYWYDWKEDKKNKNNNK